VADAMSDAARFWIEQRWVDVLRPVTSPRGLLTLLRYAGQLLGLRRPRVRALLDPAPLEGTIARLLSFEHLNRNVSEGRIDAAAVAATSALTSRTVVFHAGGPEPPRDEARAIDYVTTPLGGDHVRASAAIPTAFPAVHVAEPPAARGWYFDGGTRLNTPIKPAIALGADRVIVIGLNSIAPGPSELAGPREPDVFEASSQLMQAVLVDPLNDDIRSLAEENETGRRIPYVFVAPRERDEIGAIAARIYNERYSGPRGFLRDRNLAFVGRTVAGGDDPIHGELLSFLFLAPVFARELIELGRRDAGVWLAEHKNDPWQVGPLPG
jgi:NTE family protein